ARFVGGCYSSDMKEARDELVRINDRGEAHAIGPVASQRLRARVGAYRMLPAPGHVVFMRYTGEDGRRDDEDGAIVLLSGEITAPGSMCDIFALLGQSSWRGELVVLSDDVTRSIFFEQGRVLGVQTDQADEKLGRVLYRYGVLTEEQLAQIAGATDKGDRFGKRAVDMGLLKQEQVYDGLRRQTEEVVFSTLTIGDGTFFFLNGFNDERLVWRHVASANALLMDAVTRMDEVRYFREKIPSSDFVPQRTTNSAELPEDTQVTYEKIDGSRSVEELGRATGRGEFSTTKDVYTLLQSKHIALNPPRISGGLPAIAQVSNEALRIIHRTVDDQGKGEMLRSNLASFAAGAGVYDILLRGAGPDEKGALTVDRVVENTGLVARESEAESTLKQMLGEYVSFALFSAGAALGEQAEAQLSKDLGPLLAQLQSHAK
ncbi:MAG TPA: DUF4388 domain-containing protein, partial [Polyangiaceae bacterium]|nr:DUF4388 domain-containing protein [Polyangiaceae bacterium]